MASSKPALRVLGISLEFAQTHSREVVLAVADSIYRTTASMYHPDKGSAQVQLPKGVTLSDLGEARDSVRKNLDACIKEIESSARKSHEMKQIEELNLQIAEDGEVMGEFRNKIKELWNYIARDKHQSLISDVKLDKEGDRIGYMVHNLNGLAFLISTAEGNSYMEYSFHRGVCFVRAMVKVAFSTSAPCPPDISQDLIVTTGHVKGTGYYYAQTKPHAVMESFTFLGSYEKAALTRYYKRKIKDLDTDEPAPKLNSLAMSLLGMSQKAEVSLDTGIIMVLQPYVAIGNNLIASSLGSNKVLSYKEIGSVVSVRMFDPKQRP